MAYLSSEPNELGGLSCGAECSCKPCRTTGPYLSEVYEVEEPPTATKMSGCFGQAPAAPDSALATAFTEAHPSRWCTPGQVSSATCRSLPSPRPIRRVFIHTIASAPENDCVKFGTIRDVIRSFKNPGRAASSHYLVDRDGTITQMVREANVAFHVIGQNNDSVGIEHADICNKPDAYTTELYESSAALVRDIAGRNGFALSVFGIDTNDANAATVLGHQALGHHGDPGPYWDWEYYARLLRWDGRTLATRPVRIVSKISASAAAPAGWERRSRAQVEGETRPCIPNNNCADNRHSYSDGYWRAEASTPGVNVLFPFSVTQPGLYKISLWWPKVRGANPATQVEAEVLKAGGPAMANGMFNQTTRSGRWNDLGAPFTFTVPATGAQGSVRVRQAASQPGVVLADAVRILKVA